MKIKKTCWVLHELKHTFNNKGTVAEEQSRACLIKNAYSFIRSLQSKRLKKDYLEQIIELEFLNKEVVFDLPNFQTAI